MSNTFHAIIFALLAAFSFVAHADDEIEPARIEAMVKAVLHDASIDIGEHATGDLNHDGLPDMAVLVRSDTGADQGQELKLLVFLADQKGGYVHFATSGDFFPHERVYAMPSIDNNVLVLQREGAGGCCSRWAEEFKFKMVKGELVLIGIEIHSNSMGDKIDDSGTSSNFLTRKTIFWRQMGKKRKELKVTLPPFALITLAAFTYGDYEEHLPAQSRGYLDEQFQFKQ